MRTLKIGVSKFVVAGHDAIVISRLALVMPTRSSTLDTRFTITTNIPQGTRVVSVIPLHDDFARRSSLACPDGGLRNVRPTSTGGAAGREGHAAISVVERVNEVERMRESADAIVPAWS